MSIASVPFRTAAVFAAVLSASAAVAEDFRPEVGKPFVFTFTPVGAAKPVSFADLKGKVVVIDFWATWCPPCRAEMPHMKELYSKYKDKGVEFVGVSLDRGPQGLEKLVSYCKANEITWLQAQGPAADGLAKQCAVRAIPTLFIVDKKGVLRDMKARGRLDTLIPQLLEEK